MNGILTRLALGISILIAVIFGSPLYAYAAPRTASASARQADAMTRLRTKADAEIDRRTQSLNNVLTQLNNSQKLSADDKSTLASAVQSDLSNLASLKTKVDGDTQITSLRTDVQSIVKDYRVYALLMPKISIVVVADRIIDQTDKINDLITSKIQPRIQAAQSAGKDVTAINAAVADIQTKTANAKSQAQQAEVAVMPLTPDGYPANKTTLTNARANLQTARQELEGIHSDVSTIISQLKSFNSQ